MREEILVSKEVYIDKLADGIFCPNCIYFDPEYETCEHKYFWRDVIWSAECSAFTFVYVTNKTK